MKKLSLSSCKILIIFEKQKQKKKCFDDSSFVDIIILRALLFSVDVRQIF